MICPEKQRLLKVYAECTSEYKTAVALLRKQMGTLSRDGYLDLVVDVEGARLTCERARLDVEQHDREHCVLKAQPRDPHLNFANRNQRTATTLPIPGHVNPGPCILDRGGQFGRCCRGERRP